MPQPLGAAATVTAGMDLAVQRVPMVLPGTWTTTCGRRAPGTIVVAARRATVTAAPALLSARPAGASERVVSGRQTSEQPCSAGTSSDRLVDGASRALV
jgi:hypothetical protein